MLCLLDADIVAYRCAASSENESLDIAIHRVGELVRRILHDVGATEYEAYLSGTGSYRKALDPTYKAHRTQERPKWLEDCREYLITEWKAKVTEIIEADDAIGIQATASSGSDAAVTIASLDKDLFQIPTKHFQWEIRGVVKGKEWVKPAAFHYITPLDGIKHFYKQMLIGDKADNITGVMGIGEVKASKAIDPLFDEIDMFNTVWSLYTDKQRFFTNAQLLWILKNSENQHEILSHFLSLPLQGEAAELLSLHISRVTQDLGLEPIVPLTATLKTSNGFQ